MSAVRRPRIDVFIDANVLLYLLDTDVAKHSRAEAVLLDGGVVSAHVLGEVTNVLRGKRWKRPSSDVHTVLANIRANMIVLPVTVDTHARAVSYAERYRLQYFDALHVASAAMANCHTLFSEDMHHGLAIDGVTVRNPFQA